MYKFEENTLKTIINDEILEIEDTWFGKTFVRGKNGYYVVSIPHDADQILVEKYTSKKAFDDGEKPKQTIVDRTIIDSTLIVAPDTEIIELIYGKKVISTKIILDDSQHFPPIERETIYIQFVDQTFLHKSLYALGNEFHHFCGRYGLVTTTTTSDTLTGVSAVSSEGQNILSKINKKPYMAAFDLAYGIYQMNKDVQKNHL